MEILFSGANTQEQASGVIVVSEALQLDLDGWPVTAEFAFSADPSPELVDEFAITTQTYFNIFRLTFRNDAPHFQNGDAAAHFDITRFYWETIAHEIGHVLSGAMNTEGRTLLGRLFSVGPAQEEWFPAEKLWQDRAGEAIAETFKEAFLPASYREYGNRTNIILQYPYYPLFRAIFRNAVTDGLLRDAEANLGLPPGDLGSEPTVAVGDIVPGSDNDAMLKGGYYADEGLRSYVLYNESYNPAGTYPETYINTVDTRYAAQAYLNVPVPPELVIPWTMQWPVDSDFLWEYDRYLGSAPDPPFGYYYNTEQYLSLIPRVVDASDLFADADYYNPRSDPTNTFIYHPFEGQTQDGGYTDRYYYGGWCDITMGLAYIQRFPGGGLGYGGPAIRGGYYMGYEIHDVGLPSQWGERLLVRYGLCDGVGPGFSTNGIFTLPVAADVLLNSDDLIDLGVSGGFSMGNNHFRSGPFTGPHVGEGAYGLELIRGLLPTCLINVPSAGGLPINTLPLEPGALGSPGADSNDHRVKHRVSGSAV